VRRAIVERDAHRVAAHPETRVALCDHEGTRPAELVDLSANGVGLRVPLGLRAAGRLGRIVHIELTIPMADPIEIRCEVRHMDVRASGTLLGLRFDPEAPGFAEHQARIAAHVMRRDAHTFIRLEHRTTNSHAASANRCAQ
jgi:c-di-GMP-binding flagellar brake protein YcgR